MAENNEIKVKVTSDVSSLKLTTAQLEYLAKLAKTSAKNMVELSEEQKKASAISVAYAERAIEANKALQTSTAKTMRSYFDNGEELRKMQLQMQRTNPAMISLNQIVQDAPFGLRGMGNNIQFLTQQFTQLRSSGMSTKEILTGMMQNVLSPMGALMMGVSISTSLLTMAFDKMSKSAKNANAELDGFNTKALQASRRFKDYEQRAETSIDVDIQGFSAGRMKRERDFRLSQVQYVESLVKKLEDEKALLEDKGELDDKQKLRLKGLEQSIANYNSQLATEWAWLNAIRKEEERRIEEAEKGAKKHKDAKDKQQEISDKYVMESMRLEKEDAEEKERTAKRTAKYIENLDERQIELEKQGIEYKQQQAEELAQIRIDAEERVQKASERNLRNAMNLYNSLFFDPIRAGFDAVINKSGSFADAFVGALKKMLAQMVQFAITAGILSLITGIPFSALFGMMTGIDKLSTAVTPVGGASIASAGSAMSGTFGKSISKRVVGNMSSGGRANAIEIYGETRIKDDHVLVQYKRANAKRKIARA